MQAKNQQLIKEMLGERDAATKTNEAKPQEK
jgi:hypothetical protein